MLSRQHVLGTQLPISGADVGFQKTVQEVVVDMDLVQRRDLQGLVITPRRSSDERNGWLRKHNAPHRMRRTVPLPGWANALARELRHEPPGEHSDVGDLPNQRGYVSYIQP